MALSSTVQYARHPGEVIRVHVLHVPASSSSIARVQSIVQSTNWKLTEAGELSRFRMALRSHPPVTVVICDQTVETASWKEFLRATREISPPPAFIVLTGQADTDAWTEALNGGADDSLAAGFETQEIRWVIANHHLMALCKYEASRMRDSRSAWLSVERPK